MAYRVGLENRSTAMYREFESHLFRHDEEGWPRGLRQQVANLSYGFFPYRGFESPLFRQNYAGVAQW